MSPDSERPTGSLQTQKCSATYCLLTKLPVSPVFPGEYVIIVEDVTSPPFMGQTLPTAFALLSLLPAEG